MTELERRGLVQRLLRLFVSVFPTLDVERIDDTWPVLLPLLTASVQAEFDKAAVLGAAGYMRERSLQLGTLPVPAAGDFLARPVSFDRDDLGRLQTSLTVVGPVRLKQAIARGVPRDLAAQSALVGLQGVATRSALAGDTRTTLDAVAADPEVSGWARVPRPDACPWCLMLASRGPAYNSRESALVSKDGRSFHDHCKCMVIPVFDDSWYPPKHVQEARDLYAESTRKVSGRAKIAAFREAVEASRKAS